MTIRLPHLYEPRKYQTNLLAAMDAGYKRYLGVWHRRAGKDKTALQHVIKQMQTHPAVYYYFFPTYAQGKKVLWDGIDATTGVKMLDHFPAALLDGRPNSSEMKIKFRNGSLFQIVGTDNWNSIMGTTPYGCVFSEYSLQNPAAWDYIRPILMENKGWAIFIYTPRGRNHGKDLYDMALKNPAWYVERLTIADTRREDGSPVVSQSDVDEEIRQGLDADLALQEFFCSFEGHVQGSYYSKQMFEARKGGRIRIVPFEPTLPVNTAWDLGMDDSTTIWFYQQNGPFEVRLIDYYEQSGEGIAHYAKVLKEKPYVYGTHYMPHDVKVRELGTGKSRQEVAEALGIRPIEPVPTIPVNDGIEAVRNFLPRCYFNAETCRQGIAGLEQYHKEYDEEAKVYRNKPEHDWSSHAADAFRMLAVSAKLIAPVPKKPKKALHPMAA